ncbi:MAG TPA: hypothetical protein VKV04_03080 [Verrucomicrobiae bacterium]|nr:hypothetical protein [Verrucomicrobiae bacterium]
MSIGFKKIVLSGAAWDEALLMRDCHEFQPPDTIKVTGEMERRCSWCDDERGVHYVGNVSHTICLRHLSSNLMEFHGKDSIETLYWSVLTAIAVAAPQAKGGER